MKKSLFLVLVFTLLVGLTPSPARAFELGNVFSSITSSFQQRMQRVYLALPGNKSGEAVVQQSFLAMEQVETLKSDTKMTATLQKDNQDLLNFNLSLVGPVKTTDVYDPSTYQQEMKVVGSLTVEGTTLAADADLKMDGSTVYLKFNQIPAMPFLPAAELKDQWLKMDSTQEAIEPDMAESKDGLTDEQKNQLKELSIEFVKDVELSDARRETVDGVKAFVVDAVVSPELVKEYLTKAAQIEGRSTQEVEEMVTDLDKALALVGEIKAVMVIDRSTFYMTKFELPLAFDLTKIDPATATELNAQVVPLGDAAEADTLKLSLISSFSEFNKPIEFSVPTDARDASEVFSEAMGGAMGVGSGSVDMGVGKGAVVLPPAALENSRRPVELPELTAEEEAMLKQYGIDPKTLR